MHRVMICLLLIFLLFFFGVAVAVGAAETGAVVPSVIFDVKF